MGRYTVNRPLLPLGLRRELVDERGNKCEWCNKKLYKHVHHINGNPWDNRKDNLMLVCYRCHFKIDRKWQKWVYRIIEPKIRQYEFEEPKHSSLEIIENQHLYYGEYEVIDI